MRFLLTNDDGIDAPGLAALEAAVSDLGHALVVAPDRHLSGCSHQVTFGPLSLERRADNRHSLSGTPVDCTRVGLVHLGGDIEWVLSGINDGGNLGADVYHSGTVAAVREAVLLGKPGIAISHYRRRMEAVDWATAARWSEQLIRLLLDRPRAPSSFWNVNLPHLTPGSDLPEVVFCPLDPHPLPVAFHAEDGKLHYRGSYQDRASLLGHDVAVCFSGRVAVTQLVLPSRDGSDLAS